MNNWAWTGKYVVVIFVALILGVILGELALFKSATLGSPKFTAARLVQFITHAAALALLWGLGWKMAEQMRQAGARGAHVGMIVVSLTTLLITSIGYIVLSNVLDPFIAKGLRDALKWVFVLGVLAAGGWFMLALFAGGEDLIASMRNGLDGKKEALSSPVSE